jgi:hypothetical protein
MCELRNLGREKVVDCIFALEKQAFDGTEDCSNYLDQRTCNTKANKLISNGNDETQIYVIRKIKVGTWAKTSLREEAAFVLRCVFRTNTGRVAEARSASFKVIQVCFG